MGPMDASGKPPQDCPPEFEDYPLTRPEYINVMVHFYRGEIQRSTVWRQRLDATTNWAVLTTAGMLSFSLADSEQEHILLLLSNLIILCYLIIEARRYRYFEVYRSRVRMIEENFLIPVLTRKLKSPEARWRQMVAGDLDQPTYKTTLLEAIGFRLRRNYIFVFGIVLGGWIVKVISQPHFVASWSELWLRIASHWAPTWVILGAGVLFYTALGAVMWYARHIHAGEPEDEIAGFESDLEHWKR
jgi:uncharacterized membrane protein